MLRKFLSDLIRPSGMNTAVGVGYSGLMSSFMSSVDQPVTDFDALRGVYDDMSTKDETIMTGLGFLTGNVVNKIGEYINEDERVAQLVRDSTEALKGTIEKFRRNLYSMTFAQGYGVAEKTYVEKDGRWLLSSLTQLPSTSCRFIMGKMPDNSVQVVKVQQTVSGGEKKIPAYKCIISTYGRSTEVYGDSMLKPCYRWYRFKEFIPKFWAVGLDRYGTPIIHGKANDPEPLRQALGDMHTRGWLATTMDAEFKILAGNSADMSDSFSQALNACNKMIYRSMFLPSLLEGGESGGSYALGDIHWQMFNDMTLQLAKDYAEMELEQLWRPLIEYNFGPQEQYGELPVSDSLSSDEKNKLADVFQKMITVGVFDELADNEWMRDMLRVPQLDRKKLQEAEKWESSLREPETEPQE